MDKFQVLEELAPGAFGTMLIVEEIVEDKEVFSLKKVECVDEGEANTALSEAMALLKLQNLNICPYKEFFITWDNETSSLFLCLVMKYLGSGDLASLIRAKRLNKERIEITMVQMFLGQAVDALVHIHKMNIIHRNLKPSNIMLQDDGYFVVTDFSVETLMNDEMKLRIRIDEECKSWMAPEALKFSFSEKSDIWSLGCILLEMLCCPSMSDTEVAKLLCDLRHDPSVLTEALQTLTYIDEDDSSFFQVLQKMLQINPNERPTARELADMPYVKDCLALCGSPLSGLKKKLPPGVEDELLDADIERTIEFMQTYEEFEDAQILALQHLLGFMGEKNALCFRTEVVQAVAQAMSMNIGSLEIQLAGFRVLHELIAQALKCGLEEDVVTSEALITALLEAIRTFPNSEELIGLACSLLMMVTTSEATVELLGGSGVISDVLQILQRFAMNREICLTCTGALASLAASERFRRSLILEDTVKVVCDTLRLHLEDGEVAESICIGLWVLSLQGLCAGSSSHVDSFADHNEEVTLLLLQSIKKHMGRPVLVQNACLALASLLRTSELAVFAFLLPKPDYSGISLIKECFQLHSDDPEVVEYIVLLLRELAQYGDILQDFQSQEVAEMLNEITFRFGSSKEIVGDAETMLQKLQQYAADLAISMRHPSDSSTVERSHSGMKMLHAHSAAKGSHPYRSTSLQLAPTQDAPSILTYSRSAPVGLLPSDSATKMLHPHSDTKESPPYRSVSLQLPPTQDPPTMLPHSHSAPVHLLPTHSASRGLLPPHRGFKEHQPSSIDSSYRLAQSAATKKLYPHSATKESPLFRSASLQLPPTGEAPTMLPQSYSATGGLLPSHSATVGTLPPHSATEGLLPSDRDNMGLPATHTAAMALPPSHRASIGHPPSSSDKTDVPASQSASMVSHLLHTTSSATIGLPLSRSASAGQLPPDSSKEGPHTSHSATAGQLPSDSAKKGPHPSHSATADQLLFDSAKKGPHPSHSATVGPLSSDSTKKGLLPSRSSTVGLVPSHSATTGPLPSDSAKKGLHPSHSATMGPLPAHSANGTLPADSTAMAFPPDHASVEHTPSSGAKTDLLTSQSATVASHLLSTSHSATVGSPHSRSANKGLLPSDRAKMGLHATDSAAMALPPSRASVEHPPSRSAKTDLPASQRATVAVPPSSSAATEQVPPQCVPPEQPPA